MPAWLLFLLTATAVIVAGARLARDGDAIAGRSGLGATWMGAILVAGATSLPEISTGVAAIRQGQVDLTLGDLFGSNMANMAILAVADLLTRQHRLLSEVAVSMAMVAALAVSLTALAAIGVLSADNFTIGWVGWCPWLIAIGYALGMRMLHRNRARPESPDEDGGGSSRDRKLWQPIIGFTVSAAIILIAAPHLTRSGTTLAQQWGIATGFFGVVFLAAATSLPEVAVVAAAIRNRAYDLAVGNLLGSNCFNMLVLVMLDLADGSAALLSGVDSGVVVAALIAMLLMGEVLLDLLNRPEKRVTSLEPGPTLTLATYAVGLYLTYRAMH
jgi:cation:H+ antiporter